MAIKDLTGQVFGELTVIEFKELDKRRSAKWVCKCSCGRETIVAGDSLKRGATKSCGKCVYYSHKKDLTGQTFGRLTVTKFSHIDTKQRAAMWEAKCSCGKKTVLRASALTSGHTISCGCFKRETDIKKMTGSNSPNWKGGITPENQRVRTSATYKEWRKSVFERDNYTCQKCGKRGGELHAHHIRSFATNPKLRTDLKNGTTLCLHCHLSFHARFGNHDNNKRQLNSFMKLPI
jgi:hypothetical protein